MNSFLESKITVSPERIRQTAAQASAVCKRLIARIESVDRSVDDSLRFWASESSELLYDYYTDDKQNFEKIKRSLRRKTELLNEIAAMYENTEKEAHEAASTLPDNIII